MLDPYVEVERPTGNYATAADIYSAAGWQGILPVPAGRKEPPPVGYTGKDGRWPSKADMWDWRIHQPPDCNVALRLPPDVIGLDVDQYGDKLGWDHLIDATRTYGLPTLQPTWRSSARESPSGILFFRVPAGVRLKGEAAPGVEIIQYHHRFAIVWPSLHPKLLTPYLWTPPGGKAGIVVPRPTQFTWMATPWVDYLTDHGTLAVPADLPAPLAHREELWDDAVQRLYHTGTFNLRGARAGSRHEQARGLCMALCRMEQNGLAGSTAALDAVGAVFVAIVATDRGTSEAEAEWRRLLDGGRQLARTTLLAPQSPLEDPQSAPEDVDTVEPTEPVWASAVVNWSTFWQRERAEDDFLVAPLLARGRSHAIFAAPKVGKSLLTLDVCAARATGKAALDSPDGDPISVVYFDLEMTEDDLQERLDDLGYGPDNDLSMLSYYLLPTLPPLDTPAGGAAIEQIAGDHKAELLVIDTTGRVVSGEENSADTYRAFYRNTGSRLKRMGVTVARLDHAGKDPTKGQRGSSAKADDVDVVWYMTPTEDGALVRATHRRISWVPESFALRREECPLRHMIVRGAYPEGTRTLAARLDAAGVPSDASRRKASLMLKDFDGVSARHDSVTAALRYRLHRDEDEWIY